MIGRILPFLILVAPVLAEERVEVCYNWDCAAQTEVVFDDYQWLEVTRLIGLANNPAGERALVAQSLGRLYHWAGEQTPIHNDRAGNRVDEDAEGRMDCIDHSTTTTRFLKRLEASGALHWHRVLEPERRTRFIVVQHFAAVIEEQDNGERFAVDSWFVDNGQPAVVLPLAAWMEGEGPSVE
jgi:hypothetical protein